MWRLQCGLSKDEIRPDKVGSSHASNPTILGSNPGIDISVSKMNPLSHNNTSRLLTPSVSFQEGPVEVAAVLAVIQDAHEAGNLLADGRRRPRTSTREAFAHRVSSHPGETYRKVPILHFLPFQKCSFLPQ